jgi:PAS domain S-box-containing protein
MLESPWAAALLVGALVPLMGARRAHLQAAPASSGAGALARGGAPVALQLGIALWIAGHAARHVGLPPQLDAWLLGASRLGLLAISPSVLLVAWGVARPDAPPKAAWVVGLAAVPVLLLVLTVTTGVRDLDPWSSAGPLEAGSLQELAAWIHLGYATACVVSAFALLARASARTTTYRVRHVLVLFAAFGGPLAGLLLARWLELWEGADAAAGGLLATSLAFGWGLERSPRVSAPPEMAQGAEETPGDEIPTGDAILVVDEAGQLQDVNAAARHLLGIPLDRACGRPVRELLADHPDLLWLIQDPSRSCGEFFTGLTAGTRRCHEVRISSLDSGTRTARIVTIQESRTSLRGGRPNATFDTAPISTA